ncbi:MAG TPA: DUF4118 domain-containing protein [Bacteroidales bacterium]|nr:DUF4118 domain-containing protein [Bacteroidales bacterium]
MLFLENIRKLYKKLLDARISRYILVILVIGVTVLCCIPLSHTQGYHVISFILLFVVSLLAIFLSTGPVLLASSLSALVWNFFFIPPHYTFHIDKPEDILMFCMFFSIALLNGVLTTRVRRQEKLAREREERTKALFILTKELSKSPDIEKVLTVSEEEIVKNFNLKPVFVLQNGSNVLFTDEHKHGTTVFNAQEEEAAQWAFEHVKTAGRFTNNYPSMHYTFYPLKGSRINPGVVRVHMEHLLNADKMVLWQTFLSQISNALEREFLGELAQKARFLDESDRLYKTLFNSISHELRIPVATIMGAADTLISTGDKQHLRNELYFEISAASLRLNRLIENLLNMSRLESGRLSVRLDWHDINDLINKVTDDLSEELKPFTFAVAVAPNMPLVRIDFGLMEQVLYNLLFNSTQHAKINSELNLRVWCENNELFIEIKDGGPGFPPESLGHVFDKFFKVDENITGGLGLGLSIVKGFIEAHKGTINVENLAQGGARFLIRIPSGCPDMKDIQILQM